MPPVLERKEKTMMVNEMKVNDDAVPLQVFLCSR